MRPVVPGLAILLVAGAAAAQSTVDTDALGGVLTQANAPPFPEGGQRLFLKAVMEPYAHAIASLGFWALLCIALIPLSVAGKARARTESGLPVRDYSDPMYRRHRALQNAIEASGPFVAATVAAILAGAPPFWVNLFASVFIIARFSTAIFHIVTESQALRSATWAVGMLCLLGLTGLAVFAAMNL